MSLRRRGWERKIKRGDSLASWAKLVDPPDAGGHVTHVGITADHRYGEDIRATAVCKPKPGLLEHERLRHRRRRRRRRRHR
jgi:hypothetical protein